jgi:hypothetical protein
MRFVYGVFQNEEWANKCMGKKRIEIAVSHFSTFYSSIHSLPYRLSLFFARTFFCPHPTRSRANRLGNELDYAFANRTPAFRCWLQTVPFRRRSSSAVYEQVAQRNILRFVTLHLLAVSVSAASDDDGQVAWVVCVRVAQVASEQHRRLVEQPFV